MKKTLLLFSLLISTFCFSQTVFHAQYFQLGMWDSEIDDYEIQGGERADIFLQGDEDYFIFTIGDETVKSNWTLDKENSSDGFMYFQVEDFEGEPSGIAFSEEEELYIYIYFAAVDGIWQNVMILSDITVEE